MFEHDDIQEVWLEAIDEIDPMRKTIAYERACKKVGVETEWVDGVLHIFDEGDKEDEVLDEFASELKRMVTDDALQELVNEGKVEAHVAEDGSLGYSLTEEGKKYVEEELLEEE